MSMGDPMLNWSPASSVARMCLESGFAFYVSTVGMRYRGTLNHFIALGERHGGFGLQFSLLAVDNVRRRKLFRNRDLPYLRIDELLDWGWLFGKARGEYERRREVLDQIRRMREVERELRDPRSYDQKLRLRKARHLRRVLEETYRNHWGPLPETPAAA